MEETNQLNSKQAMELKRERVIALYLAGKSQATIVRQLKHLQINKMFVFRTITRYKETGSIAKRNGGGPTRTATSPEMIQRVKAIIKENPTISGRQLAVMLSISQERIQYILKKKLNLISKLQETKVSTIDHKRVRTRKEEELFALKEGDPLPDIIFSTEDKKNKNS